MSEPAAWFQVLLLVNHYHKYTRSFPRFLLGTDISSSLTTEKDRANALLMASKHLPTSLFSNSEERKGMVLEAVESLQKIGEKDRITRCRKLLLSM